MVRQLLVPALLAAVLLPVGAAAYNPCSPYPPPQCPPGYVPVVVYGPPVHCQPAAGTVAPRGPVVVPERMDPPKKPETAAEKPKEVPAKGEEFAKPKPADPTPEPKKEEPKKEDPKPLPPVVGEKIPPQGVPPVPPKGDLGKLEFELPPIGEPTRPTPEKGEPVKPMPEASKPLPPLPPVKKDDAPKPPEKLPAFDLDLPKPDAPAQPVEANKPVQAKKVAVSEGARGALPPAATVAEVEVFPRDGAATGGKRGVTFVNKSGRDILLTVDGQTTTLPSKTVLRAELPAAFKWQIGGEPEREQTVPAGSSGLDVVIRK